MHFLTTPRLGFRRWTEHDLPLAWEVYGDPELTALIGGPFTYQQVQERFALQLAQNESHGVQIWPVDLLATGENVGCCGFKPYARQGGVLELGFIFRKAFWGQGIAPEAGRAAIDYARRELHPTRIGAGHHPLNERSGRVLARLGFRYSHQELYEPTGLEHPFYFLGDEDEA